MELLTTKEIWAIPPDSDDSYVLFKVWYEADDQSALDCFLELLSFSGYRATWSVPKDQFTLVGPRSGMVSSFSTNVVSILNHPSLRRVERYRAVRDESLNFDPITEEVYVLGSESAPRVSALPDRRITDYDEYVDLCTELNLTEEDIAFYWKHFQSRGEGPTIAELHDLGNSNSEHSRHHLFRGAFEVRLDTPHGTATLKLKDSMMDMVKSTLQARNAGNSLVAFFDNSSAIEGWSSVHLHPNARQLSEERRPIILTAETHNFPTGIAPFEGAATGVGGRIRDIQAFGRGGQPIAGLCGYSVGDIELDGNDVLRVCDDYRYLRDPIEILLRASDGASDYGNKFGEPQIGGFTRSFGKMFGERRIEWAKPIMFSAGIGLGSSTQYLKETPSVDMVIARVGGPTYRIGIGGGAASSTGQAARDLFQSAVQRGDPEMENKLNRWVQECSRLGFIQSIHDQGAGGMANVTKEIVENAPGLNVTVDLNQVALGDSSLSDAEIWVSESQEQVTVLVLKEHVAECERIADREMVPFNVCGTLEDAVGTIPRLTVIGRTGDVCVQWPLGNADVHAPKREYLVEYGDGVLPHHPREVAPLASIDVGSKRFLTTKVDRSVTGLVAQQQCVGPTQAPVADVAVVADSIFSLCGIASAIGEHPIGLIGCDASAHDLAKVVAADVNRAIIEMLTNLVWAPITSLSDLKCSANWMCPAITAQEKGKLRIAVKCLMEKLHEVGIAIDGGKDSVSMTAQVENAKSGQMERIDAPCTLVLTAYAPCTDIRRVLTPELQSPGNYVFAILIDHDSKDLRGLFETTQRLMREGIIVSGHDVSDGGLDACIAEMCFASDGLMVDVGDFPYRLSMEHKTVTNGIVFESRLNAKAMRGMFGQLRVYLVGQVVKGGLPVAELRDEWERYATALEKRQLAVPGLADEEHRWLCSTHPPLQWSNLGFNQWERIGRITNALGVPQLDRSDVTVMVLRAPGSNGDSEMRAAFHMVGARVIDVPLSRFQEITHLDDCDVLVFVGGFSYSDVLGAGAGWAAVLQTKLALIEEFMSRPDTLALGVCNGCQVLARLGLIDAELLPNVSGRFESRFARITVSQRTGSPWLEGLGGLSMGMWSAHGEGRFKTAQEPAMVFADEHGDPTERYPMNPNGSPGGAAAITSHGGRVLAMMPHPERSIRSWQLASMPRDWRTSMEIVANNNTPWLLLFDNAIRWVRSLSFR